MRIIQYIGRDGAKRVGAVSSENIVRTIRGAKTTFGLATEAIEKQTALQEIIEQRITDEKDDLKRIIDEKRIRVPFHHPDPYRQLITGTGLSHLGSASARDSMHAKISERDEELTDSMKMFKWGVEGGKPGKNKIGAQAEWFYKGDGDWVVHPEASLNWPNFALDGGEEIEIVGIYIIDNIGNVRRVGFALANEYADHVMEKQNYLNLAHSKLRQCSYGPELLLGDLPEDIKGKARLVRKDSVVWEDEWLSGNKNMCHSVENLEHHHFKYREFRRPGDVHIHFLGAANGSFTENVETQDGDIFEIHSDFFGSPLRNTLTKDNSPGEKIIVKNL